MIKNNCNDFGLRTNTHAYRIDYNNYIFIVITYVSYVFIIIILSIKFLIILNCT